MAYKQKGWRSGAEDYEIAAVTSRRNAGNKRGAKLAKKIAKAGAKGKKSKAKRLRRKLDEVDQRAWEKRGIYKTDTRIKKKGEGGIQEIESREF